MGDTVKLEIIVDDKGSLVIKNFKDVVNKSMGEVSAQSKVAGSSISDLWKSMALGTVVGGLVQQTFGGIRDILKSSTQEFMNSQAVHADMVEAMKDAGLATESNIAKFDAFADSILATTTISGEMTRTMLTLGMTMKVPNDRLEEAAKLSIGLGKAYAASGLDSISAMKGIAAAMQGNFTLLSRYIPALASAKTEQEKWAIVQKVGIDGFRREEESIKTDLGAWKQFGNYVNDFKGQFGGVLVGIIKFLISMKDAILAAATAMGVLFVVGKISAWVSALKAGEGALMLIVQQAQMLQKSSMLTEGIGRVSAYAQSINYASGQVVGLSGILQHLPAVGIAAFAGWEIGKVIGDITGLNSATQDYFELMIQQSFLGAKSTAELTAQGKAGAETAAAIRGLGQELGVTSGSLHTSAAAILQNKEAFNKLPPEIQAIVTRLGTIPPAAERAKDALSEIPMALSMINPALIGLGQALAIAFQGGRTQEAFIEANTNAMLKQKKAAEEAAAIVEKYGLKTKGFNEAGREMYVQLLQISGLLPKFITQEELAIIEKYGLNVKGFNEAGREMYFQLMQMVGILPQFTAATQAAAEEQARLGTDTGNLTEAGRERYAQMLQMVGILPKMSGGTKDLTAAEEQAFKGAQDLAAGLQAIASAFNRVIPGLGDMTSGVMGAFSSFKDLQKGIAAGTATFGSFLGTAAAVVTAVFAINDAVQAYLKNQRANFIVGMNESIAVTKDMAKEIEALAQKYYILDADLTRTNAWDAYAAATSESLGKIIGSTNITVETFDKFAIRTREILSDLDRGTLTAADAVAFLGDAFTSLIAKAKELGTEGSASLITMYEDLASRGLHVAEIQDYINSKLEAGADAYATLKDAMDSTDLKKQYEELAASMDSMKIGSKEYAAARDELSQLQNAIENATAAQAAFGNISVPVFDEILAYRAKLADNKGMVDAIQAATTMMTDLTDATRINQTQFDQFSTSAGKSFDALIKGGMNGSQAIQAMGPYLQRLQFLHEQYGFTIDANTQKILDQAIKEGKVVENKKTETQQIIDLLGGIAKALGADIPDALDKTGKAASDTFKKATDEARKFNDALDDMTAPRNPSMPPPKRPEIPAATGYQGWVRSGSNTRFVTGEPGSEDEYVSITPRSRIDSNDAPPRKSWGSPLLSTDSPAGNGSSGGGSKTWNLTFNLPAADNPEQAADNLKYAIYNNVHGVKSLLERL